MLNAYMREFDIKPLDLEGKRVLDLGTSVSLAVARELKMRAIQADVVSFSPIFADPYLRAQAKVIGGREGMGGAIAGMGESLPFADRSFDYVLALHVFEYLKTAERKSAFLAEVARVLAPEGVAYIGPFFAPQNFNPEGKEGLTQMVGESVTVSWQQPEWRKNADNASIMKLMKKNILL